MDYPAIQVLLARPTLVHSVSINWRKSGGDKGKIVLEKLMRLLMSSLHIKDSLVLFTYLRPYFLFI